MFYHLFYFLLSSSAGTASLPSLLVFLPSVEAGVFDYTSNSRVVEPIKMIAQKLDLFYLFKFHIVSSHRQYRLFILSIITDSYIFILNQEQYITFYEIP